MKILFSTLLALGVILSFGMAYADMYGAETMDIKGEAVSMIHYLDPSSVPVATSVGIGVDTRGFAAGGFWDNPDSLINTLDPSNAPAGRILKGSVAAGKGDDPDSLIRTISPESVPN